MLLHISYLSINHVDMMYLTLSTKLSSLRRYVMGVMLDCLFVLLKKKEGYGLFYFILVS